MQVHDSGDSILICATPHCTASMTGQNMRTMHDLMLHTDHLGTPQLITDNNQAIVWSADYTPFDSVNITTQMVTNNLRFPGQYYDQETGLHYNYFRDYDPSTGRYVESDPIGLDGGNNTYGYVHNNPLIHIDPFGLVKWTGDYKGLGATFPTFGVLGFVFDLISECINDVQAIVEVTAIAPQASWPLRISVIQGDVVMEDHNDYVDPSVFYGSFGAIGGGITVGGTIGSLGRIRLGSAWEERSTKYGFDIGVSLALFGISFLSSAPEIITPCICTYK